VLKNRLREIKRRIEVALLRLQRSRRAPPAPAESSPVVRRLLILPSDPWTLVGAKGDEAMMQAVVQRLRRRAPDLVVGVVAATPRASQAAQSLGFEPVAAWSGRLARSQRVVEAFAPDAVVVLGADVMDGYYSPVFTTRVLLMADAAARRGVRVTLLGFSFNDSPHPSLRPVFDGLARTIAVNVRDEISLARFRAFCALPARLVADAAFMLEPDAGSERVAALQTWTAVRRAAGDAILGFNLHPMLIKSATTVQVQALVAATVTALRSVAQERRVSVMLIPHDYRGALGDATCLAPLRDALGAELGDRLRLVEGSHTAAELKALAGLTDGVVTGRMHLAIASLGMGRPVAALTYQDKFQGLFAHFDIPDRFLLGPHDLMAPGKLQAMVLGFIDRLPALQGQVADRLEAVRQAAERNLIGLASPSPAASRQVQHVRDAAAR